MIAWLINLLKHWLGHKLLADEEEQEKARDAEITRKRKEIMDAHYTTDQTADDLDRGEF